MTVVDPCLLSPSHPSFFSLSWVTQSIIAVLQSAEAAQIDPNLLSLLTKNLSPYVDDRQFQAMVRRLGLLMRVVSKVVTGCILARGQERYVTTRV